MVTMAAQPSRFASRSIALRKSQVFSRRNLAGKGGGVSTIQPSNLEERAGVAPFQNDAEVKNRAHRKIMLGHQYPGKAMPRLQEMSNSLHEGDSNDVEAANNIDNYVDEIADESDAAPSLATAARARSGAKSAKSDGIDKMMEKMKKDFQAWVNEFMAELKTKAGVADQGEGFLLGNLVGLSASIGRSFIGLFSASLEKYSPLLEKIGMPIPKKLKIVGAAGTAFQFFLFTGLIIILSGILIFIIFAFVTATKASSNPFSSEAIKLRALLLGL